MTVNSAKICKRFENFNDSKYCKQILLKVYDSLEQKFAFEYKKL